MEGEKMPEISVISPVYGVERYIGRAVESMMNQTLGDVEFIFVDDCTPDKSIDIVKKIVSEHPQRAESVRIIRHEVNKGLPAARNTGMESARGKYIFHWDSDDYAEPEMLESMLEKANAEGADYVWCDWFLTFDTGSRTMVQPAAETPRKGLTAMLSGALRYNVWNKLVARSLYNETGILFPEGKSMGEDMTMIKLLAHARKVTNVSKPFYHYIRTNSGAMTQIYSERHLRELKENTENLCEYLVKTVHDRDLARELNWFRLNVKLPFLFSDRNSDMALWSEWYSESNRDIMSNKNQALRTRLLQLAAAYKLTFINRAYNALVFKFIYGKIYR